MVYSTCSILAQENEEVLRKVVQKSGAEIVTIKMPEGVPVLPTSIDGVMCVCSTDLYEGFFVAKIRKKVGK